jgi:hypothetical protein
MGLFSALLGVPLAPVRGVVWLADQIQTEAERQWTDPAAVRRRLDDVEEAYAAGELTDEEREERQDALLALLVAGRQRTGLRGGSDG